MYNPVYPSVPGLTIIGSNNPYKRAVLQGSASDDLLISEFASDTLIGGAGADIFAVDAMNGYRSVTADFEVGKDKIALDGWYSARLVDGRSWLKVEKFEFVGNATQFSRSPGAPAAQAIFDTSSNLLIFDSNKDGLVNEADLKVSLPGVTSLAQSDFVHTTRFESTADVTDFIGNSDNETAIGNAGQDRFFGGYGSDLLLGGDGIDFLDGGAGADTLYGGNDADVLEGGDGDDRIVGGRGSDAMVGGGGSDVFAFTEINDVRNTTSSPIDSINDFVSGEDKLDFRNFDIDPMSNVQTRTFSFGAAGPAGSARLVFDASAWQLKGDVDGNGTYEFAINIQTPTLTANDLILSDKTLQGGATGDTLSGGTGDDTLIGGGGSDHLLGGFGADVFVFKSIDDFRSPTGAAAIDFVDDFASGVDKLDFRNFDVAAGAAVSTRQFTFIGNSQAFRKDGSAQLMFSSSAGKLYGDTNGDGAADFTVQMQGVTSLSARDLILA